MDVLPIHLQQSVSVDVLEEASGCPVPQCLERFNRLIAQIYCEGVALAGADQLSVFAESETLFVIDFNHLYQVLPGDVATTASSTALGEELLYVDPAATVELEVNDFRLVSQNEAEEFTSAY